MDNDTVQQGLARIRCPICENLGSSSLSYAKRGTAYPGDVYCCVNDSSHLWVYVEGKKGILSRENGEICVSYREEQPSQPAIIEAPEDSATLITAFDPIALRDVILKAGLQVEAAAIVEGCRDRIGERRAFELATIGFVTPDPDDIVSVWSSGIQIEALVKTVRHVYLDISLADGISNPFLVGIFCEPLSARAIKGDSIFRWDGDFS